MDLLLNKISFCAAFLEHLPHPGNNFLVHATTYICGIKILANASIGTKFILAHAAYGKELLS
jgi:hypothetical protein